MLRFRGQHRISGRFLNVLPLHRGRCNVRLLRNRSFLGSGDGGDAAGSGFGRKVRGLKTTSEELPDYVERVLRRFQAARDGDESFAAWTLRASEEELS